jgi:tetratricopeptide (TPR) repeat protein
VFAPSITQLKFELQSLESIREHPAYLGHGSGSDVFSIEYDDKQYAVRIPGHKADAFISPNTVDSHINGAVLGRGVAHLEQIVAASYEDGVTVAEMMPGKEISYLTAEEIQQITDVQLEDLVTTLQTVSQRGIEIDPKPSNFFYDERKGFGVVDYASSKEKGKSSRDQNLSEIVGWMGTVIANAGFYKGKSPETVEDYAQALEKDTANLDILKRYRAITAKNLANQEGLQEALEVIDKRINNIAETVANYSNPEYVTERIVEDARWKKERENATPLSWLEG